jgi:hypothetical protein
MALKYYSGRLAKSYCRHYRKIILKTGRFRLIFKHTPWTAALVICPSCAASVIVEMAMTHFPQTDANRRAPRLQLNGSVAAAILVEGGQRARAKLQSVSVTGGLLQVQHELSTGDFVEIAFQSRSGPIYGMAEMLRPTRKLQSACLQPFRFVALGDDDHRKLRNAIDSALDKDLLQPGSCQSQASAF